MAKEKTNVLRKNVCSAVLIQSAWRGFVARKKLLLLKHVAISLQARWRGKAARMAYRVMVEELRKQRLREAEERKMREAEKRWREEEEAAALKRRKEEESVKLSMEEVERYVEDQEARGVCVWEGGGKR